MKNSDKTREQLLRDLEKSKKRIAELEKSESKLKQAEEELRDQAIKLNKAQNVANMGFLDWNLKTNEIELSEKARNIFGLDPDQK